MSFQKTLVKVRDKQKYFPNTISKFSYKIKTIPKSNTSKSNLSQNIPISILQNLIKLMSKLYKYLSMLGQGQAPCQT